MNGVAEHLAWMAGRLRRGEPFCHLRFNDGEARAMNLVEGGAANCDGHTYFADMAAPLRSVLLAMADDPNALIGSIVKTDPGHATAQALSALVMKNIAAPIRAGLTVGEFWCREEQVEGWEELQDLCARLRERHTILVSNSETAEARHCLRAQSVLVSGSNAWLTRAGAMRRLLDAAGARPTFVWCCGFVGKVLAWQLKTLLPGSTHLDAGHTFDGVYGNRSREWMRRDSDMSRFYFDTFAPWVRSFER